jgi:urease accessory protein
MGLRGDRPRRGGERNCGHALTHSSTFGRANLRFAVREGRTRLTQSLTRPPLVVQRALYTDEQLPDLAVVFLANPTAGIFAGDNLEVSIELSAGARVHITTPSATKVHAMPEGDATQCTRLVVGESAYLEYLPEPVIPQQHARFTQETSIVVAPGGSVIYGEIVAGGRHAMGEALAYARLATRLTVSSTDHMLYYEVFTIEPLTDSPRRIGLFGSGSDVALGTWVIVTPTVAADHLQAAIEASIAAVPGARIGVAELPGGGGIAIKALARDSDPLRSVRDAVWSQARRLILGVGCARRRAY